ncbi:hypothetical protein V9T40_010502 [Parthenolecanium corni]|uniref:Uncharacterized protein n=1 Tax=Parthenolecanium corni TaxID=536013 RepID=A0AAN9XX89_9HEMI
MTPPGPWSNRVKPAFSSVDRKYVVRANERIVMRPIILLWDEAPSSLCGSARRVNDAMREPVRFIRVGLLRDYTARVTARRHEGGVVTALARTASAHFYPHPQATQRFHASASYCRCRSAPSHRYSSRVESSRSKITVLSTKKEDCEKKGTIVAVCKTSCIQHAYSIQGVPVLRSELTSKQLRGTYATRAPHLPMVGPRRRTNSRNSGHYFRIFVRSKLRQSQILVFARVNESSPRRAGCSVSKINAIVASAEK